MPALSRRSLLHSAAAIAAGSALPGTALWAQDEGPLLNDIGIQLYTLRDALARDFEGTLQRVAEIGYREIEFAGYYDRTPAQLRQIINGFGLSAPAAHVSLQQLAATTLDATIEAALIMGHDYLVLPWLAPDDRHSLGQYLQLADLLNTVGQRCREANIRLAYHNHDFEFVELEGQVPYEVLLASTETDLVAMELDLYWLRSVGENPESWFRRYPGRFALAHVKDMDANGEMVDVGSGIMDYASLITAAKAAGIQYFFVEHDKPRDPLASAERSYQTIAGYRA